MPCHDAGGLMRQRLRCRNAEAAFFRRTTDQTILEDVILYLMIDHASASAPRFLLIPFHARTAHRMLFRPGRPPLFLSLEPMAYRHTINTREANNSGLLFDHASVQSAHAKFRSAPTRAFVSRYTRHA